MGVQDHIGTYDDIFFHGKRRHTKSRASGTKSLSDYSVSMSIRKRD